MFSCRVYVTLGGHPSLPKPSFPQPQKGAVSHPVNRKAAKKQGIILSESSIPTATGGPPLTAQFPKIKKKRMDKVILQQAAINASNYTNPFRGTDVSISSLNQL